MREIKFRVWDKIRKIMNSWEYIKNSCCLVEDLKDTKEFAFMQFTGLKDKNGKEICEGDIVKDSQKDIFVIKFNQAYSAFRLTDDEETYELNKYICSKSFEVIGNIYENPELLEVGK